MPRPNSWLHKKYEMPPEFAEPLLNHFILLDLIFSLMILARSAI